MSVKMYRCCDCQKFFDYADEFREHHADSYFAETIGICPYCKSTNFEEFNPTISKIEIADRLLEAVKNLHIFRNALEKLFGENFENKDLDEATGNLTELFLEMFPFTDSSTDKLVFALVTSDGVKEIMNKLEGLYV